MFSLKSAGFDLKLSLCINFYSSQLQSIMLVSFSKSFKHQGSKNGLFRTFSETRKNVRYQYLTSSDCIVELFVPNLGRFVERKCNFGSLCYQPIFLIFFLIIHHHLCNHQCNGGPPISIIHYYA